MAAQGGLVTYGSSVTAGMVTVREEGVGLFDHLFLSCHKYIFSLLMARSVFYNFCNLERIVKADFMALFK